jgi:hypothetical protein
MITRQKLDVQSETFMFTIKWNPNGFYVVDRLPDDTKMNRDYFATKIDSTDSTRTSDLSPKKGAAS